MKKIAASVGLLALGASALCAAESSTLNSMQNTKAWSVQATLRGFYDDNIGAVKSGKTKSVGFEVSPSIDYGFAGEQTSFNVGYDFTARYFDKKAANRADRADYTHTFNADFAHAFSPRLDFKANDSFVIGQEPDLIGNTAASQPIDGDNIRNFAGAELNLEATRLLGFSFGYNNSLYDYADDLKGAFAGTPSNSGIYDRIEHEIRLDTRWKVQPQTTGIIGYTYKQVRYTADEQIGTVTIGLNPAAPNMSYMRNSDTHRMYAGLEQVFNPSLSGSVRVGAEFTTFDELPDAGMDSSPYVSGALTYQYRKDTSFSAGVTYSRSAAAATASSNSGIIRDMESTSVYASVRHQLAQKLFLSGSASLLYSKYNAPGVFLVPGGPLDGESYFMYTFGLDLSYEFTQILSGHVGYNYDQLKSDPLGRDYSRNRVYLGLTAGF